jgi:hypothetical protein
LVLLDEKFNFEKLQHHQVCLMIFKNPIRSNQEHQAQPNRTF